MWRDEADVKRMAALGSVAGAVAHHLNNLLGGIVTAVDFAQGGDNPEMLKRALRTVVPALARINALSRALLIFAEGDRSDSSREAVVETVRRFVADHEAVWEEKGISVSTAVAPLDTAVPVRSLLTILEVLTTNACEAMPEGGRLRIELGPCEGGMIVLRVADSGRGIPAEQINRVFEPFFTTKTGLPARGFEPPGLGLAAAHGIVSQLGGTVSLTSAPEGGTVCSVHLPSGSSSG
jgi:signal transduction histidine kinase